MSQNRTRSFKRATAIKMHINHILTGKYVKDDINHYIETKFGFNISRVRILGTIVGKWMPTPNTDLTSERTPQATLIIDDGTETIRIKAWKDDIKMFEDIQIGDIVDVIGHVRKYESEIYITPEIIRKIEDPNWELVRELEIIEFLQRVKSGSNLSPAAAPSPQVNTTHSEPLSTEPYEKSIFKDKILEIIREFDEGSGVSITLLKEHAHMPEIDFQDAITELINEGTIYQPSAGKYKIL
ncbi:MAG: OB-fold nucleic acid binding domain-containing protein [Candidatus Helarchaeota archaeon]